MTRQRWAVAFSCVALLGAGLRWSIAHGHVLNRHARMFLGFAPFLNRNIPHWYWAFAPICLATLGAAAWLVRDRVSFRSTVAGATILSAGWTVLLAATDGWTGVTGQLARSDDFLPQLNWVQRHGWRAYFAAFHDEGLLSSFPTHVRSHPPGMVALLSGLDSVGLGGPRWAAVVVLGAASTIPLSVAVAVRCVADSHRARLAAVLVAITPAAVFMGTTPDAFYAAVAAAAIALAALASERGSWRLALGSGVVTGLAISLTYGTLPLVGLMCAALVARTRRPRQLVAMAGGALMVVGVWALVGFNWFSGLSAVARQYALDTAQQRRPYSYFVIANLVVFGCLVGPAVAASIGAARRDGLLWLAAPAALAVLVADVSGLSKGEVERIWLPFVPWVTVAGVWLLVSLVERRRWMALLAQVGAGLALQSLLLGIW